MPFVSKTGVSPAASQPDDRKTVIRLLNAAKTGVDVAFRSLTLDTFLVRGISSFNSLAAKTLTVTGAALLKGGATVTGNETISGTLGVTGNTTLTGNLEVDGTGAVNVTSTANPSQLPYVWETLGYGTGLAGAGGTIANKWKIQFGSTVQATDAGGNFTITFPTAFPNGLLNFICINGDQGSGNLLMLPNLAVLSLANIAVHVFVANTGGAGVGTYRCNWIAIGW